MRKHYLIFIYCVIGIYSNMYSQNVELKNLTLKFIDSDTFLENIIYGFKDLDNKPFYFISAKYESIIQNSETKLNLEDKYNLSAFKLSPPIILRKIKEYSLIELISYFEVVTHDNKIGEQIFSEHDTVKVDLYYSPSLFINYFIKLKNN